MNPDLKTVRLLLADVMRQVPDIRTVYPMESRDTALNELPTAWVWGFGATPSDDQQFGERTVDFTGSVRVMHVLDEDGPAQVAGDRIMVGLMAAIDDHPFLDDSGIVDRVVWSSIDEPAESRIDQQPVLIRQMNLIVTMTWAQPPA